MPYLRILTLGHKMLLNDVADAIHGIPGCVFQHFSQQAKSDMETLLLESLVEFRDGHIAITPKGSEYVERERQVTER